MFTVLVTLIQFGIASVYTDYRVACPGERYSAHALIAAHKTLPCGSRAEVTNLLNGRKIIVRIVDRGPYKFGRVIDLTPRGAQLLGMDGLAPVSVAPLNLR